MDNGAVHERMSGEGTSNLIRNPNFCEGEPGQLPAHWTAFSPKPNLLPSFQLIIKQDRKLLRASGNGSDNCAGWLASNVTLDAGEWYRLSVQFEFSDELNPQQHLLFSIFKTGEGKPFNEGIAAFQRLGPNSASGEVRFEAPSGGGLQAGDKTAAEVRIGFRQHGHGKAWIRSIALERCEPIGERLVRVACIKGRGELPLWGKVLDAAAARQADLVLLPETFIGMEPEALDGPCASLMSEKARQHGMYVAGTFMHNDAADGFMYNTGLLFGREGETIGRYDKQHPFSKEFWMLGCSSGSEVPVFTTDFGTIGMMICYDSWFTDVTELLALKGAEIILFPNASYYRSIVPARAVDNCVRIVCSSLEAPYGVWDTSGCDVEAPELDPTRHAHNDRTFRDVVTEQIEEVQLMTVTLDLNQSPSAHNWGGPMMSSPGGRRNRREQKLLLLDEIKAETNRWWST